MRILPEILLITAGLSLGFFIASGLVALVIGLGIVTRYAGITKTAGSLRFYECCCMAGALFGDLFSLGTFSFSLPSWSAVCTLRSATTDIAILTELSSVNRTPVVGLK